MGKDYKYTVKGFEVDLSGSNVGQGYPVAYGTVRLEGNLVYAGQPADAKSQFWTVWNFSEGEVDSILQVGGVDQLFLDDTLYTTFGSNVAYWFHTGSASQTYDTNLNTAIAEWTDNKRYAAYLVLKMIYSQDLFRGMPKIELVLKGRKLYDIRTGTTAYSDNPAICLYDYLTNARYGLGVDASKIHQASWIVAAEYADLKGWTYNRALGIKDKSGDVVDDMVRHLRGSLDWYNGLLRLNFADLNYQVSVLDLTDEELYQKKDGSMEVSISEAGRFIKPDAVRVRYSEPESNYADNEIVIGDSYGNIQRLDLAGCADRDMASQLAIYELERKQLDRTLKLKGRGDLFRLWPNAPITASFAWLGIEDQAMRVQAVGFENNLVSLELKYDALSLYDDDYDLVAASVYTCSLPDPNDPPPSVESATIAEELYSYLQKTYTRLNIGFNPPSNYPWFSHVEVHRSFDDATYEHLFSSTNDFAIDPVEQGAHYYIKLRAVSIYGVKQLMDTALKLDKLILGKNTSPMSVTGLFIVAGDNSITLYGVKLLDPEIEVYEFRLGGWIGGIFMASLRSPNLVLNGVKPGDHTFYINTLSTNNLYGDTPRSASASLPDPPKGWSVTDTDTCDYNGVGVHKNTEHTTYDSADHLKCSHTGQYGGTHSAGYYTHLSGNIYHLGARWQPFRNLQDGISHVKLFLFRNGTPSGSVYAYIYPKESGADEPDYVAGYIAKSAGIDVSTIDNAIYEWIQFDFEDDFSEPLYEDTTYFLIIKGQDFTGDDSNYLRWSYDSSATRWGLGLVNSSNAGSTWSQATTNDYNYQIDEFCGRYTSPEYDLGSTLAVLTYILADVTVTGAGTTWGDIIPSPTTWSQIGILTRTWQEIFALEAAPSVAIALKWGTISGTLSNKASRMEILCALCTGRYFQVQITITDPSDSVNALVEEFTLKYCV